MSSGTKVPGGFILGANDSIGCAPASEQAKQTSAPQERTPSDPEATGNAIRGLVGGLRAGRSAGVKVVPNEAELRSVYARISSGGTSIERRKYQGDAVRLSDGTEVGIRCDSKSGGPTIDIRHADGTTTKVHIQ